VFVADIEAPSLGDEDRRHLLRVLRLRRGEVLSVADGAGRWRLCTLADDGRVEPSSDAIVIAPPLPPITVAMAVPKGDRPEWAVGKLTEIGVDRIIMLTTARGVVRWDATRAARHLTRLQAVARAAAMQSRRLRVPTVEGPMSFEALVAAAGALVVPGTSVAGDAPGDEGRQGGPGGLALAEPGGGPPALERPGLVVGPEGGWTPDELAADLPRVALAPTVLRTETAAVVGAAILVALRSGLVVEAPSAR
jgi:16S rRNA (uracil1498-N3)-methyltransferase